jgi:ATP-dependent Clp protease ATP-binding subunit ClpC
VFERFDDEARRVVVLAQEEARRLDHDYIGTEHLLLGVLRQDDAVGAKALRELGISLDDVRASVEEIVGRGAGPSADHLPFTWRAKDVLRIAVDQARARESLTRPHDLLVAVLREGEGVAAQILGSRGVRLAEVRAAVDRLAPLEADVPDETSYHPKVPDPRSWPLCSQCGSQLAAGASAYRTITLAAGVDEILDVTVVYCSACGRALGVLPG